jgi:hypothetical protein
MSSPSFDVGDRVGRVFFRIGGLMDLVAITCMERRYRENR